MIISEQTTPAKQRNSHPEPRNSIGTMPPPSRQEADNQPYLPSPWEIEEICREIRSGWSEVGTSAAGGIYLYSVAACRSPLPNLAVRRRLNHRPARKAVCAFQGEIRDESNFLGSLNY